MADDAIGVLNGLIETCKDGELGFREASENVQRQDLKELFAEASQQRGRFAADLQREVQSLGGDPDNSGSVAGALHRAWIDVKGTFTGKDDASILAECERGEDSAVNAYTEAIKEKSLSVAGRSLIEGQAGEVQRMHDSIKAARDRATAKKA